MTRSVFSIDTFGDEIHVTVHCDKIAGGRSQLTDEMVDLVYHSDIEYNNVDIDIDYLIGSQLISMFRRDSDGHPVLESFVIKNLLIAAAEQVGGTIMVGNSPKEMSPMDINEFIKNVDIVEYNLPIFDSNGSHPKYGEFEPVMFLNHTTKMREVRFVEVLRDVDISFTIQSVRKASETNWAMLMSTAENLGIGAARYHGYGKFTVVDWDVAA